MTTAVCFDVDFTLIYPGPTFRSEGYRRFGVRHGLELSLPGAGAAPRWERLEGYGWTVAIE